MTEHVRLPFLFGTTAYILCLAVSLHGQSSPSLGFNGDKLEMTLDQFKTVHVPAVLCAQVQTGITSCGYDTGYADESSTQRIDLKVTGLFLDNKLAGLWITVFEGTGTCFEAAPASLGPAQKSLWMTICKPYMRLFQIFTGLTDGVGTAKPIASKLFSQIYAIRWENETSIGEFQPHQCLNTDGQGAWFSEVLDGNYCNDGKPSGSVAMMIYLSEQLIRAVITRLGSPPQ